MLVESANGQIWRGMYLLVSIKYQMYQGGNQAWTGMMSLHNFVDIPLTHMNSKVILAVDQLRVCKNGSSDHDISLAWWSCQLCTWQLLAGRHHSCMNLSAWKAC